MSGKTYRQQKIREVACHHLHVSICNFRLHTPKQWEAIHANLTKFFTIDPPLKPLIVEKYLQEHLSFARQKWRKIWSIGGDITRPNSCPMHAWGSLVKY